jgi:multicomponent Na+:H+ antiporter subunit G
MNVSVVAIVFGILGTGLIVVAGIGIVRMPDLPTRMHASSKAGTLGAILLLVGVAIAYMDTAIVWRVVLIVMFLSLTAPVAAHMIARAGYRSGVPLTPETVIDEYREVAVSQDRQPEE